jgi:hypothetical protein
MTSLVGFQHVLGFYQRIQHSLSPSMAMRGLFTECVVLNGLSEAIRAWTIVSPPLQNRVFKKTGFSCGGPEIRNCTFRKNRTQKRWVTQIDTRRVAV